MQGLPLSLSEILPGYRDWKFVSVAHEQGELHDIRVILGNETATNAYRENKIPFPEGTVIARLAWSHVPRPIGTYSSWSKTQRSTRQRAVGDTVSLIRTVNLPTRRRSKTCSLCYQKLKLATPSLLMTRLKGAKGGIHGHNPLAPDNHRNA